MKRSPAELSRESSGSWIGLPEEEVAMPGTLIKGAFVEFMQTFVVPMPNVIVFQYNPETITHTWTQPAPDPAARQGEQSNPLAVKGVPGESFSFNLSMDAGDVVSRGDPVVAGIAMASGVYTRLAALEMLQYPVPSPSGGLLGMVSASIGGSVSAAAVSAVTSGASAARAVPKAQLPTVLFVWGPGRIVPVRVTSLTITEKLYDIALNPTHADAQIGLQVLTPDELNAVTGPLAELAKVAYTYSQGLRQVLAAANLANSADSILGMLPV
jgi:hypothetical protein